MFSFLEFTRLKDKQVLCRKLNGTKIGFCENRENENVFFPTIFYTKMCFLHKKRPKSQVSNSKPQSGVTWNLDLGIWILEFGIWNLSLVLRRPLWKPCVDNFPANIEHFCHSGCASCCFHFIANQVIV